ncbi:hypothetical protein LCGC14_0378450 [marine sediment metagenome]|uniref:Uncharacterized protein n=1 Tax=marine sediment metagenome TaxID=412755 RepID=A0A0F9TL24_9ZZZZ
MAQLISNTLKLSLAGEKQQFDSTANRNLLAGLFTAGPNNTGELRVGVSTVNAASDPPIGKRLMPGEVLDMDPAKFAQNDGRPHSVPLSSLWFDGTVTGDIIEIWGLIS